MARAVVSGAFIPMLAAAAIGQAQPSAVWKEFTLVPASHRNRPLERTVQWTYEATGATVTGAACCPWLEVEGSFSRIESDPWTLRVEGISLKSLIAHLESVPQVRMIAPAWMSRERYTLTVQVSGDYRLHLRRRTESAQTPADEVRSLALREIEERLQVKLHREFRLAPVFVMKGGESTKLSQPASASMGDPPAAGVVAATRDGSFRAVNADQHVLLTWLQNALRRPISPADLPPPPYSFHIDWKAGNQRSLVTALWEQLGLAVIEERRELEFLVIDYALKPEWR